MIHVYTVAWREPGDSTNHHCIVARKAKALAIARAKMVYGCTATVTDCTDKYERDITALANVGNITKAQRDMLKRAMSKPDAEYLKICAPGEIRVARALEAFGLLHIIDAINVRATESGRAVASALALNDGD